MPSANSNGPGVSRHYDRRYASWQKELGEFGGWAELWKFKRFVRPEFNVIDFGCGGGYLLAKLNCQGKIGVEPNEAARQAAEAISIPTVSNSERIDDGWADLLISNHALEHTLHPLTEICALRAKLKPGGMAVFFVPCEGPARGYVPGDINHHLYSWSPMCLGNLFVEAGYEVESARAVHHKWPPGFETIASIGGRWLFELSCRIWGQLARSWCQVRVVARNPER